MGRSGDDERLRVLRFWWMLELFSPQKLPDKVRLSSDRQVVEWDDRQTLPWEVLDPPKPLHGANRVWRHTVYLGVYELEATYSILGSVFGEDPDAYDERPAARSACAGLLVDDGGHLVTESPILSSALWAAARARSEGKTDPHWMEGFELAQGNLRESVDKFESARRTDKEHPSPLDSKALIEMLRISHRAAGVGEMSDLASQRVLIASQAVSATRASDTVDIDFLNSFYLDDLAAVRERVADGEIGDGLAAYLATADALALDERIDIVEHPEAVEHGTAIERLPKGRWPASPKHGLALSQQFAVNRALNDLGAEGGLMGVNGPPGTGKTTMLRDILAGNVVERARRLARLSRPDDAFDRVTHRWTHAERHRIVRQLRPELTGFEMVVASSNNAAVENVTTEIPSAQAIDAPWRGKVEYFGDIATEVLRGVASSDAQPDRGQSPAAWGLVGARLGNKRNRAAFYSSFWFDEKESKAGKPAADAVPRMHTRLKRWKDRVDGFTPWAQARQAFMDAEYQVDLLIQQRAAAQERLQRLPQLAGQASEVEAAIDLERTRLGLLEVDLTRGHDVYRQTEIVRERAVAAHQRQLAAKPGFLETVFSFGRVIREWREAFTRVAAELEIAEQHSQRVLGHIHQLESDLQESRSRLRAAEHDLAGITAERARLDAECARDAEEYGVTYPGPNWRGDQRELHAPWLDEPLNAARSNLFIAALQLHQDFIANTAVDMLNGLRAAGEVLAGNYPHDLDPEKLRAAWQLFFLAVPLISTTFASVGRMLGGLGAESIGWLLIDEAGQSCPQYAVGAIWRARRVIAVGDPLQLEPVVTLPAKAQRSIATAYDLDATWMPPRASVQTLADRVTRYGTLLDQGEDRVWVSAPLRVHRRCDNPMFDLCNQIAYNGLMVNGVHRDIGNAQKPDLFDGPGRSIVASHWVDEPSRTPGDHFQPSQIARLEKALNYLADNGVPASEVIAISPFRVVADKLNGLAGRYPGLRAGTIHTAQGREAAVVVLVLGGDPSKPGAPANWARTPNLVNVAASRAKRRLFVIGDRELWARHPYFRELSKALDQ